LKAHHYPVRLPSIWSSYLIVLTLESVPTSAREQQRSVPRYKGVPVAYPEVQSRRSNSAWHFILTSRVVDARGSERILVWQRKGLLRKVHQVRASGFDSRLFDACQHQQYLPTSALSFPREYSQQELSIVVSSGWWAQR
jgi:hypothetical protein